VKNILRRAAWIFWHKDLTILKVVLGLASFMWAVIMALSSSSMPDSLLLSVFPPQVWVLLLSTHAVSIFVLLCRRNHDFLTSNFVVSILGCFVWLMLFLSLFFCTVAPIFSIAPNIVFVFGAWWIMVRSDIILKRGF